MKVRARSGREAYTISLSALLPQGVLGELGVAAWGRVSARNCERSPPENARERVEALEVISEQQRDAADDRLACQRGGRRARGCEQKISAGTTACKNERTLDAFRVNAGEALRKRRGFSRSSKEGRKKRISPNWARAPSS